MQKDNSTFNRKRSLRLQMLSKIDSPVVMETHGGIGKLFASCYSTLPTGIVFEKDPMKADFLARQRPTWAVYRCDSTRALAAGAGAHLMVNFLDLDPYGSPWEVIDAFFSSKRPFADKMVIVVNDGLRQKLQLQGAWNVKAMGKAVARYGDDSMFKRYKEVCREMLADRVIHQGYRILGWTAYYTGFGAGNMTHWAAILTKQKIEQEQNAENQINALQEQSSPQKTESDISDAEGKRGSGVSNVRERTSERPSIESEEQGSKKGTEEKSGIF